ncbi:lysine--tRNA ligase [Methanomicrobium antiquum]|uniref:Lysine--tRNA ligase n=1 Tax=Methanomicrobium antiquum TaxID=487686 RepID=A0AAF0FU87_9EURY|nr:lysine--tRNA ligase [Methanomicrobium antiquum]MDD3976615.1 lysine--tRNA ligase [Methanomicrobium sp.]WFN36020.1 lysine--tRNA ligase [Methanomicrobium antiquum]
MTGGNNTEKVHWADVCASEVMQNTSHLIATGITPSGPIHIGNMREVVTGDLVYKAMIKKGLNAELIYNADDFDPLRKVYPFLPKSYEQYIGLPICDIPCPCGKHKSYAEHFLEPFLKALEELDVKPTVLRSSELYRSGKFTEEIKTVLENAAEIKEILERVSRRKLPDNWVPFYPICKKCKKISNAEILGHDPKNHIVKYRCECGYEGECDYSKGEGKLVWRVDWPMRWAKLNVTVEPFGKDHSAAGGSFDTGKEIVDKIFKSKPPYPVAYEWISLKGKGAMASSTGVAITIDSMLEIVPPDVLRYLIARSKPEKAITFDPGMGLLTLIDEYAKVAEKGDSREYELSKISSVATDIPFRHLVTVVQIATDDNAIIDVLKRSGYDVKNKEAVLKRAQRAKIWIEKYAPDMVKFTVQEKLPQEVYSINDKERYALEILASKMEGLSEWNAENLHNAVYKTGDEADTNPKDIFTCIYMAILGKERGPRAGWFLEALGREFVTKRIVEAVSAGAQ